jgi:hypothetical protein
MTYQAGVYRKQGGNHLMLATAGRILDEGGVAAGPGLSPAIWSDCPIFQMKLNPALGIYYFDDFLKVQTTGFPYKIQGTNGTFLGVPASRYGVAQLLTGSTIQDECYVTSNNNLAGLIKADIASAWWFETSVKLSQIATAQGVFVGLLAEALADAATIADTTGTLKIGGAIGFQIIAATDIAAIWQTQISLAARVAVCATAATASLNSVKLGMKSVVISATAARVTFYIDGAPLADTVLTSATNFPLDSVLCLCWATKALKGVANALNVDWVSAAQLR